MQKMLFRVFTLSLLVLVSAPAFAQKLKFGPRFGVAASGIQAEELMIKDLNDVDALRLELQNASPEAQLGVFGRLQILGFYVQPEALLTTSSAEFLVEDLQNGGTELLKERYYNLEVPLMAGVKLGPLRAQAGPVYHMNLGNASDFTTLDGFSRRFRDSAVGFQAGAGLDLGKKIVLDVKYELDMNGVRDEVTVFGQSHPVSQQGGRLIGSVGFSF
ncbi:MAG: outer membrane beta-barrel protein [Bacteroidia bacterium]|nr:outer membrane beta-barrel protein [Bacteroidia bacterium]